MSQAWGSSRANHSTGAPHKPLPVNSSSVRTRGMYDPPTRQAVKPITQTPAVRVVCLSLSGHLARRLPIARLSPSRTSSTRRPPRACGPVTAAKLPGKTLRCPLPRGSAEPARNTNQAGGVTVERLMVGGTAACCAHRVTLSASANVAHRVAATAGRLQLCLDVGHSCAVPLDLNRKSLG